MIVRDDAVPTVPVPTGDARLALLWTTDQATADVIATLETATRPVGLALPGGSVLRIVDMAPGCRSPMYRTHPLDYGIVLEGEIALQHDDGVIITVRAGEVVVQRGTIHAWVNTTPAWCRIAFILLDAQPAFVDGVPLPATH